MEKSLLWELLSTFSVTEKRRAVKFLASPYCNPKKEAAVLFNQLLIKQRTGSPPDRQALFAVVYPNRTFDPSVFRLLQSHLYKCLERFLTWEYCEAQPNVSNPLLLQAFRERNLQRHLSKQLKSTAVPKYEQAENHFFGYQKERERYAFLAKESRNLKLNLQQTEDALDDAFAAYKLRQACFTRSHESVFRTKYELRFLEPILAYAAASDKPVLQIYRDCYLALFQDPTDENFRKFRKSLFTIGSKFPPEEIRSFYISALNFCIRRINENKPLYLREVFELYKNGLSNGALFEQKELSRFSYNNLISAAIKLEEWDFIDHFIEKYTPFLPDAWRLATVALNRARLAYSRKSYDDALVHLRDFDHQDLITNMTGKILLAKVYYDTQQQEVLSHHLNAVQRFLERSKKTAYHHENWTNVIRYFKKLNEVNWHNSKEVEALRSAIIEEAVLTEKKWLLERIG